MHFYSIFLSTLFLLANGHNEDRQCGQDLSNLWLEIVIVVDTSRWNTGRDQVANHVGSIFANGTKIGTGYADPRSSRVGLVTYSDTATIVAELDTYQSYDDLVKGVTTTLARRDISGESYLADGLNTAWAVLNAEREPKKARPNYKKLIIVYASTYMGTGWTDPVTLAQWVKSTGIEIAVVPTVYGPDKLKDLLCQVATPGLCFPSHDTNVVLGLQGAMLQVNCFCPAQWTQYRDSYHDVSSNKYGVCNRGSENQATWTASKLACQNLIQNGYLATEFSQHKVDYLYQVFQNVSPYANSYGYHIGLNYINGDWFWQQPSGVQQLPLDKNTTFWNPGYPAYSSTDTGVKNKQYGSTFWQNIKPTSVSAHYMCEVASCDTDNYCP